ncbi:ribosomal protein L1/ribosomal biogenesis protein [Sporodiniella umbellata]|nr:ribosomal protein L1/ribosomal biogenesis protein [Sporodiniella umbellata]
MADLQIKQAKKAISALYKNQAARTAKGDLTVEDNRILIQVTTHTIKRSKTFYKPKPIKLKVNPYFENMEVCLVIKGDVKETEELIKKNNIPYIKKVLNPNMLKTTYKQFEARRKLASSYDMFLFDDRIYHRVPDFLGKSILSTKKPVVPITTTGNLKSNVNNVLMNSFAKSAHGQVHVLDIGHFEMKESEILENYKLALPKFVDYVSESWDTVNIVALRSKHSPLLPIICKLPQAIEEESK